MKKQQNNKKSPTKTSTKAKSMTKVSNAPTAANVTLEDDKVAPAEQANAQATLHYDNEKTNVADSPMNINSKMSRNISETANEMNVTSDQIQMT